MLTPSPETAMAIVLADVEAERAKQREQWGNDHDDSAHRYGELSEAAACLIDHFEIADREVERLDRAKNPPLVEAPIAVRGVDEW